eukprot:1158556-Pelagomonas_calceolata.AAC.14
MQARNQLGTGPTESGSLRSWPLFQNQTLLPTTCALTHTASHLQGCTHSLLCKEKLQQHAVDGLVTGSGRQEQSAGKAASKEGRKAGRVITMGMFFWSERATFFYWGSWEQKVQARL